LKDIAQADWAEHNKNSPEFYVRLSKTDTKGEGKTIPTFELCYMRDILKKCYFMVSLWVLLSNKAVLA
jgi:hypothetical protein